MFDTEVAAEADIVLPCSCRGIKVSEREEVATMVLFRVPIANMPDWVGVIPQNTNTVAIDAVKTGQCLNIQY